MKDKRRRKLIFEKMFAASDPNFYKGSRCNAENKFAIYSSISRKLSGTHFISKQTKTRNRTVSPREMLIKIRIAF